MSEFTAGCPAPVGPVGLPRWSGLLAFSLLLVIVFTMSANRVDDLDLWWHLKSGERIVETHAIPSTDVFSYTSITPPNLLGVGIESSPLANPPSSFPYWNVNLSNSWLGQVIFYLTYRVGGLTGIGLLKSLVFTLACLVIYLAMLRGGARPTLALLVTTLVVLIGKDFNYSRPQIFSFLFLALEIYLLTDWQKGGRLVRLLPAVVLLWANVHGGYIIGIAYLLLFAGGAGLAGLLREKSGGTLCQSSQLGNGRLLAMGAGLSVLTSMGNPNTFKPFTQVYAFRHSVFLDAVEEYARPMLYEYHAYWFLLLLLVVLVVVRGKYFSPAEFFPILFLAGSSQMGIRVIPFLALGAAVYVAVNLTGVWEWLQDAGGLGRRLAGSGLQKVFVAGAFPLAIAGGLLAFLVLNTARGEVLRFQIVESSYPTAAVEFLNKNPLPGRIFNLYDWGGFLIWNLPQNQVFIDGRCLNETAFLHYSLIISAIEDKDQRNGKPLWNSLLDEYQVEVIVTNAVSGSGYAVPLVSKLIADPGWQLLYKDGVALIFVRDRPETRALYGGRFLDKQVAVMDEIFLESQVGVLRNPATWVYYENLGAIYMRRRQMPEARAMLEKVLSINPNDRPAVENLNVIRGMAGEKPLPLPEGSGFHHNF